MRFPEKGCAWNERGQALLETAVVVPILMLLVATVIDLGGMLFVGQNVASAADSVARQIEANPAMTRAQAQAYLETSYPNLDGATVSIGAPQRVTESLPDGYRVWDARSDSFRQRPTKVSWDKREVTVTYEGRWTTPGTMAASGLAAHGGRYTLAESSTAMIDTTMETW